MSHKHPLARFSKKSNFTTNSPSPPADYENENDNTPSSSLGRELPPLTCPIANRANDCSANNLRIYSPNVQGLRGEEKLEYITRLTEKKMDAYIIQEAHLEGDFMKYLTGDKIMIHHGLLIQPRGARGGVAIILSFFFKKDGKKEDS